MFKFDPINYSNTPAWIKKTIPSIGSNCIHLGLTFGRDETLLYAFSNYNSKSTVTLLDMDGNSLWQYSVNGVSSMSLINYKAIDAYTDMAVAVVGSIPHYNRIIS